MEGMRDQGKPLRRDYIWAKTCMMRSRHSIPSRGPREGRGHEVVTCGGKVKEKVVKNERLEGKGGTGQDAVGKAGRILYKPWLKIWILGLYPKCA